MHRVARVCVCADVCIWVCESYKGGCVRVYLYKCDVPGCHHAVACQGNQATFSSSSPLRPGADVSFLPVEKESVKQLNVGVLNDMGVHAVPTKRAINVCACVLHVHMCMCFCVCVCMFFMRGFACVSI